MQIRNVIHKGLHRLIEEDDIAGVPSVIAANFGAWSLFSKTWSGRKS